ncbi:MAG: hypothetical protein MJ016_08660 [Victivallaceae bacterium]|nr:hypothetical protein [Victivallaceae bacterium]
MKRLFLLLTAAFCLAGCVTEKLPSEDIEVLTKYADIIAVLKDPRLPANSEAKYEAAKELIRHVDMSFTRETKTLDALFYHGDALIDYPDQPDRMITFSYQYGDHYVRMIFRTYHQFILRVDVIEK